MLSTQPSGECDGRQWWRGIDIGNGVVEGVKININPDIKENVKEETRTV